MAGRRLNSGSRNTLKTDTSNESVTRGLPEPIATQRTPGTDLASFSSGGQCHNTNTANDPAISDGVSERATQRIKWRKNVFRTRRTKRLGWEKAAILMVAETMSLGIMALPKAMDTLGLVIGPLLIVFFGLLSWLCGILLWKVKLAHPEVVGYSDMMTKMFGIAGKIFANGNNGIMLLFVMAGHVITWTEMVRVWAGHNTPCLVLIKAAGMIVMALLSLPKLLRSSMPLYILAAGSIITAAFILMIDGGVANHHLGDRAAFIIVPIRLLKFSVVASTISNIMISYAGHMAYFQVMAEMKEVEDFGKALTLASAIITIQYTLIAVVVYYYYGQDVASPALSSASPVVRKIAWTVAIPTIIVAGVIAAQILNTDTLLLFRKKDQLQHEVSAEEPIVEKYGEPGSITIAPSPEFGVQHGIGALPAVSSRKFWMARTIINCTWWLLAFILSNVIPGFSNLLALLGALVGWSITIGQPSLMWLWMEWNPVRSTDGEILWQRSIRKSYLQDWRSIMWLYFCACMLVLWPVAAITGTYGSAVLIKAADSKVGMFSCNSSAR